MKVKTQIQQPEVFDIRSEMSYNNLEQSLSQSSRSQSQPINDVSNIITVMIMEEKKKCIPSKTDSTIHRCPSTFKSKRLNSLSHVSPFLRSSQLPQQLNLILNPTKRYPNIFHLDRHETELDSIYGAFFGFLIGDMVGSHMAYITHDVDTFIPNALLMNGGGTYNLSPGQGTDQTQILFSLCDGLIDGNGVYSRNLVATRYMEWFESKPFNFSAVFALAMKQLRMRKIDKKQIQPNKIGDILLRSSLINKNQQSSIGLIRILPLTVFSLKFKQEDFQALIRDELHLICPNELVIDSGIVYAKILRIILLTHDHQRAFYQASKWVYRHSNKKLKELWKIIENKTKIPSHGNMGKLKTSFTYSCIEINKKQIKFMDTLINSLSKGGDTQTNCAVVMTLIGAIVGYNGIPGYFKEKIINAKTNNSSRSKAEKYCPRRVVSIIENLRKIEQRNYVRTN